MTVKLTDKFRLAEDVFYFSLDDVLTVILENLFGSKDFDVYWTGMLIHNGGECACCLSGPSDFMGATIGDGIPLEEIAQQVADTFSDCPPLELIETDLLEKAERWLRAGLIVSLAEDE